MKKTTTRWAIVAAGALLAGVLVHGFAQAAAAPDPAALTKKCGPALCLVTVENAWGVPVAVGSGFCIGDGRFVITDLGVVAQPAASVVLLDFEDGSTAVAKQFGMADPGAGVVVLKVEDRKWPEPVKADAAAPDAGKTANPLAPKPEDTKAAKQEPVGLTLAAALPAMDLGALSVQLGWQWGDVLKAATVKLYGGIEAKDVAQRLKVEPPASPTTFLRMDGDRVDWATGSPILDGDGVVLGMMLELLNREGAQAMVVSATALRAAMAAAGTPELKAFSDLPKPVWPTRGLRLSGSPPSQGDLTKAVQAIAKSMVCSNCGGKGRLVDPAAAAGTPKEGVCPICFGEKKAVSNDLTDGIDDAIAFNTCTAWAPGATDLQRAAARASAREITKSLRGVGARFDKAVPEAIMADLVAADAVMPRGIILMSCKVVEHVDGPDGKYAVLDPGGNGPSIIVRVDDMISLGGKASLSDKKDPVDSAWMTLSGTALAHIDTGKVKGIFVLPLEWNAIPTPTEPVAPKTATPTNPNPPATRPNNPNPGTPNIPRLGGGSGRGGGLGGGLGGGRGGFGGGRGGGGRGR
jgi:hypothetical protein